MPRPAFDFEGLVRKSGRNSASLFQAIQTVDALLPPDPIGVHSERAGGAVRLCKFCIYCIWNEKSNACIQARGLFVQATMHPTMKQLEKTLVPISSSMLSGQSSIFVSCWCCRAIECMPLTSVPSFAWSWQYCWNTLSVLKRFWIWRGCSQGCISAWLGVNAQPVNCRCKSICNIC